MIPDINGAAAAFLSILQDKKTPELTRHEVEIMNVFLGKTSGTLDHDTCTRLIIELHRVEELPVEEPSALSNLAKKFFSAFCNQEETFPVESIKGDFYDATVKCTQSGPLSPPKREDY